MKFLGKLFATGLLAVVPILATLYLLWWLFVTAESFFGRLLSRLVPEAFHFPGMGIALGVLILLGVGLLMRAWVFRALFHKIEDAVMAVPLVKSIYSAIRDFFGLVANDEGSDVLQVVAYTLPGTQARVIGFVTRRDFDGLPEGIAHPGDVAVYFPMSYQIGGYTAYLPADALEIIDMPREAAMRFAVTAGVNASGQNGRSR
ncbi:DUF502 domain-containing protein [Nitrogeniibacter mangrovi]|uniref:DUF502 domain-containing protein n=1 Tax=Nitrogeniibacter mangrovi TaxID=2016596 RepID=A0A6C1AYV0_9RHOO|nr:DUF502 domain-containing protein [Nitrogeniibacter mangrovi]QID16527.1 DUF502 domain-containing protein [Nitrogeniibacter mangrovi]